MKMESFLKEVEDYMKKGEVFIESITSPDETKLIAPEIKFMPTGHYGSASELIKRIRKDGIVKNKVHK
ncbi:MAG: hypothetical protein GX333_05055 [Syntrophomonadaceae bacterium]|nr:hypothetical protein [Syntrophomonadaceae bacterium]